MASLLRVKIVIIELKSSFRDALWRLFHPYAEEFLISGARNLNRNPGYTRAELQPDFQSLLQKFKSEVLYFLRNSEARTYFKFGDGDYYFLNGIPKGSAKPGRRAISKELTANELKLFRSNATTADTYLCEILPENREMFSEVFQNQGITYPAEFVYGLIANRWLLQIPDIKVGLIGAAEKLELIEHLMSFSEYKEYLGIDRFHNYVKIPQKFACDDLSARIDEIRIGLEKSHCNLYLVGIGHLKSGVLGELTQFSNSVFVDIGSGIDALAGVIDKDRPYFGGWVNYKSRAFEYTKIDLLQYRRSTIKYLD